MPHPFDDADNFRPVPPIWQRKVTAMLGFVIDQLPPRDRSEKNNSQEGLQPHGEKF
jgi:hypothetical protein